MNCVFWNELCPIRLFTFNKKHICWVKMMRLELWPVRRLRTVVRLTMSLTAIYWGLAIVVHLVQTTPGQTSGELLCTGDFWLPKFYDDGSVFQAWPARPMFFGFTRRPECQVRVTQQCRDGSGAVKRFQDSECRNRGAARCTRVTPIWSVDLVGMPNGDACEIRIGQGTKEREIWRSCLATSTSVRGSPTWDSRCAACSTPEKKLPTLPATETSACSRWAAPPPTPSWTTWSDARTAERREIGATGTAQVKPRGFRPIFRRLLPVRALHERHPRPPPRLWPHRCPPGEGQELRRGPPRPP